MKRFIANILVLLFLLPTFGPWLPHGALEALHTQRDMHHAGTAEAALHQNHGHEVSDNAHHANDFDVITFFDNLHVDLKNVDHAVLTAPIHDTQVIAFPLLAKFTQSVTLASSANQSQGPPDDRWHSATPGSPVYLTTQRLRI